MTPCPSGQKCPCRDVVPEPVANALNVIARRAVDSDASRIAALTVERDHLQLALERSDERRRQQMEVSRAALAERDALLEAVGHVTCLRGAGFCEAWPRTYAKVKAVRDTAMSRLGWLMGWADRLVQGLAVVVALRTISLGSEADRDPREDRPMICIGYGGREGVCTQQAGTPWTHLWCPECDRERRDTITRQMTEIAESFRERTTDA